MFIIFVSSHMEGGLIYTNSLLNIDKEPMDIISSTGFRFFAFERDKSFLEAWRFR